MVIVIIFVLVYVGIAALDGVAYVRYMRHWRRWAKLPTVALLAMFDILSAVVAMSEYLARDNGEMHMNVLMWILTLYVIVTLPRIAFYLIALPFSGRRGLSAGVITAIAVAGILLWSLVVTRTDIVVRRAEICSKRLPQSFDGYRIAFFSDLHVGCLIDAEAEIETLVERIASLDADLVVFGGDLINVRHSELSPRIQSALARIRARDGVVAVLGNHDTGTYVRDTLSLPIEENTRKMVEKIGAMGWRILRDENIFIRRGNDSLSLTGIDFSSVLFEYKHSLSMPEKYNFGELYNEVPAESYNITISHLPHLWQNIVDVGRGDLTLSGHVHATQIKFGRLSPARLMYNQWSGLYEQEGRYLYINDGVGYVGFYMRIGARPEITLIELACM